MLRVISKIEFMDYASGFVTTARVTHATPAALYAHTVERDYECDSKIPSGSKAVDIASQLIHNDPGKNINVMLGKYILKS